MFGLLGLWVGIEDLRERPPSAPLEGTYDAQIAAIEKDPASSYAYRKWWWVVEVQFPDGRKEKFRQAVPRGLNNRLAVGEKIRLRTVVRRFGSFSLRALEIDDWVIRNYDRATSFFIGASMLALGALMILHGRQSTKALTAPETRPP